MGCRGKRMNESYIMEAESTEFAKIIGCAGKKEYIHFHFHFFVFFLCIWQYQALRKANDLSYISTKYFCKVSVLQMSFLTQRKRRFIKSISFTFLNNFKHGLTTISGNANLCYFYEKNQ